MSKVANYGLIILTGLAKLMAKENYELMGINFTCVNSAKLQTVVAAEGVQDHNDIQPLVENLSSCEWYSSIIYFSVEIRSSS